MARSEEKDNCTRLGKGASNDELPKLDLLVVIRYVARVLKGESVKAIASDFEQEYGPGIKSDMRSYAELKIDEWLNGSDHEVLKNLGENGFASVLVESSQKVFNLIRGVFRHEIKEEELAELLSQTGIKDIGIRILEACGIDPNEVSSNPQILLELSSPTTAYQAAMAAYEEYRKALEERKLAREERLRVEAICNESIACIKRYRRQMEECVSKYLNLRFDIITSSFAAMDKAIMKNDSDGYIAGNVEIQKMLGYDIQFTNQQEFDDLMDSDVDLKL